MRYRKLTDGDDYTFGNGLMDFYIDVPEAVGQAAQTRLLLWVGEWPLDNLDGTPYMQGVIGKKLKSEADITIQERVLGTLGVTDITNFQSVVDPDNRIYSTLSFDLDTIYGPTVIDQQNYANF